MIINRLTSLSSIIPFLITFVGGFLFLHSTSFANNDLLNQAFDEAKRYDTIVNPGNDKNAVGGQVFNKTTEIKLANGKITSPTKEPYLIRLTKLILRVMIGISVSIIIFGGISYILAFGDANKQKKARSTIIYALLGILIGLASLGIVQLILSITKSSLKI